MVVTDLGAWEQCLRDSERELANYHGGDQVIKRTLTDMRDRFREEVEARKGGSKDAGKSGNTNEWEW